MKDTSENHPTSRQSARQETTTNLRPKGTSYSSRHSQTRPITSKYKVDFRIPLYSIQCLFV